MPTPPSKDNPKNPLKDLMGENPYSTEEEVEETSEDKETPAKKETGKETSGKNTGNNKPTKTGNKAGKGDKSVNLNIKDMIDEDKKRITVSFYIHEQYSDLVQQIQFMNRKKNKGLALEDIIQSYLDALPTAKAKELIKHLNE